VDGECTDIAIAPIHKAIGRWVGGGDGNQKIKIARALIDRELGLSLSIAVGVA
jgi:hypothetical protein